MSLREYIRAAARDVQAALKPQPEAEEEQGGAVAEGTSAAGGAGEDKEAGGPAVRGKGKKGARASEDEGQGLKRRKKERAQKSVHEERREELVTSVRQMSEPVHGENPIEDTELPATPSASAGRAMSIPCLEIEDEEAGGGQAGTSRGSTMYQPRWPNILEGTMLNDPILRAEWVSRALPPGELRAFAAADTFDVCDIANRAAILSTVAAYGMQRLLCAKDRQIEEIADKYAEAWAAYEKADGLVSQALGRERKLEAEVDRLRAEAGEVPSLKTQLTEARATIEQLQAEVKQLTTQGSEKDKEIEKLHGAALKSAQELAAATGNLAAERQTRRYLMTSGIGEILSKVRMSDEYGKFVGGLVPKIQTWGKAELIKKMWHDYFPNIKPDEIPYFVPNAKQEAEEAFKKLRSEPFECHILNQMAANPDMSEEEIRNLENPELMKK